MKKKFYGALLLGSLFLAGGMVSCSDYDDDINSLTQRVDALEKTVAELQKAIEAGAVITSVEKTENGVKVTLSDGKTFEVKNGTNGTPGSVVTIDEEGYWCIDGIRQTDKEGNPIKAQGQKGDPGVGTPGSDGKDGCWYFPDKDGFWHKQYYNEEGEIVDEATDIAWTPSPEESVRVVYDPVNGCLQISNAEDMEEDQVIYIPITSNLKSLAAIPYVLDDETKYPMVFFYNIMGLGTENGTPKLMFAASTDAKAHYRLNPANANTQDWDWTMIDRTVVTRAAGDQNSLLSIKSTVRENDEFIVTLESNKSLEDLNTSLAPYKVHAIAALQGINKETAEVMTSDYIKVSSKDLKDFSIITGYNLAVGYDEFVEFFELPNEGAQYEDEYKSKEADVKMLYTESLDLNTLVKTLAKDVQTLTSIPALVDDMLDKGELTYEFRLPEEYKIGTNETNQQDFVTLDGSILKVDSEKWPNGTGAIGTTPIVEVYAMVNGKLIASGLLKVAIVEKDAVEKPAYVVTVDRVNKEYSDLVADEVVAKFTWEDMRQVYDALKITREEFIAKYKYTDPEIVDGNGVTLENKADQAVGTETDVVEMTIDPEVVASNAEGVVKITYKLNNDADKYTYAPIVIEFPYTISHKHVSYPDFNGRFVKDGIATVKGQMDDNNVWTQKVEISEHFLLDSYKADGNHKDPILVIDEDKLPEGTQLADLTLTTGTLATQTLTLNTPIEGNELNVPVNVVIALDNGEQICVKSYTIRFVNPFQLKPIPVSLEAPFPGRTDSKPVGFTIVEREGGKLIAEKGKYTTYAKDTYGLTGDVTVTYSEGENNWAQYGLNNKADYYGSKKKLSLYKATDNSWNIKWENKGTALVRPVDTKYQVNVTVGKISIMSEEAAVTVTETDM